MYIPEINTAIVEIPKSGSRTLVYSMRPLYTEILDEGHKDVEDIARPGCRVVAIIRNPVDRFVSSVNYNYIGNNKETNVAKEIDCLLSGKRTRVTFKPQCWFIRNCPPDCRLDLYPMEKLEEALNSLGWKEPIIHENRGKYKVSRDKVLKERRIEEVWDFYKEDFELYEQLH